MGLAAGAYGCIRRPLQYLGLHLLLFTAARVVLVLVYGDDLGALDGPGLLRAFLAGIRYDLSIVCAVAGLPLLMLALPFPFAGRRAWQAVWAFLAWLVFVAFAFLLAGDLVYFEFVHRHFGPEVVIAGEDLDQTVEIVLTRYPLVLAGFALLAVGTGLLWRRLLERPRMASIPPVLRPVFTVLLASLLVLGARGRIEDRLSVRSALEEHPGPEALVVISGPLSAVHFLLQMRPLETDFLPPEVALAETRRLVFAPGETAADPEYPLLRSRTAAPGRRPNVVVIMLEGWSASAVDCIRSRRGEGALGLTPRFDELAGEGVLFTRFYAQGQRTHHGLAGVVCGLPTLPGIPYLGHGMEMMELPWLGRMAAAEGYETWFLQGSRRSSQRHDQLAAMGGFAHFQGAEDIRGPEVGRSGLTVRRAWDHDLLTRAARCFEESAEPFLGFLHTSNTHAPFLWPRPEFDRFPDDSMARRYRNALAYADHSLGGFFDQVRAAPWFARTVFVLVSDHVQRGSGAAEDPAAFFHIPALILAPGLRPRVDDRVGAQTDLLATIAELAGWGCAQAGIGRSLLDDTGLAERGALCRFSDMVYRIEAGGWVGHTLRKRVAAGRYREGADLDAIERRLLATVQTTATLYLRNRLAKDGR